MTNAETYRRVRNGDYKHLTGLDEFELTRFITYLLQKIREMEEQNNDNDRCLNAAENACDCRDGVLKPNQY